MAENVLFIFTILLVINENFALSKLDTALLKDVLNSEISKSMYISVFSCDRKETRIEILHSLFSKNYVTSVHEINQEIHLNHQLYNKIIFTLNLDCVEAENTLMMADSKKLFTEANTWLLILHNTTLLNFFMNVLSKLDVYSNTNIILAQETEEKQYILKEIYKYNKNNEVLCNVIGKWTEHGLIGNALDRVLANERQNLHGTILGTSIVILENDTLNHLEDYRNKHVDSISKVNYILIKHLTEYVNGSMKVQPVDSWGYRNGSTNEYTGMIGSLNQNISEIGGTALFLTKDRIPIIDYIAMTTPTKVRFVFRRPPLSYEQNIFTLPFTRALWISSFILVILSILLLYLAVLFDRRYVVTDTESNTHELEPDLLDIVMLTLGAVAQQGAPAVPKSGVGKTIMLFIFIALMFLYVSYSANIVALLQSSATNIQSLEDLLESRIKLGADDTVYNRYYFTTATEPTRKAIFQKKIAPTGQKPHFMPLDEGVRKIRQGFFAFHMELGRGYKLVADTFLESEKCGLQEINFLTVVDAYIAVKKNSIYKEIFKLGLRKIQESGLQSRELQKIYTRKPECLTAGGSFVSVGLIDSYPAFLFLGGGMILTLFLLALEILYEKKNNKIFGLSAPALK